METKVKLQHIRIAPRKLRLVADLIRGKRVRDAKTILRFTLKKTAAPISKLLNSAVKAAQDQLGGDESNLYIANIIVDEGPKLKRWRARARGQAYEIQKKTSHVTLVLKEHPLSKMEKTEVPSTVPGGEKKAPAKPFVSGEHKIQKTERPKLSPLKEIEAPKVERGIRRMFRRKAI